MSCCVNYCLRFSRLKPPLNVSQLTIYQILHTLDSKVLHLDEHLKILFESYYELFGGYLKIDRRQLNSQIEAVMCAARCPSTVSLFLSLRVGSDAKIEVQVLSRSLYQGYSLRCLAPRVAPIEFAMPNIEIASSAREELIRFANSRAKAAGADLALRSYAGVVDLIEGAQIFGIIDSRAITAKESFAPEHALAKAKLVELGYQLDERAIELSEVNLLDELFFVDHYGVTAIRSCATKSFMSITAAALAAAME